MNTTRNSKFCFNCNGEVHLQSHQCHHCGAELPFTEEFDLKPPFQMEQQEHGAIPQAPYQNKIAEDDFGVSEEEWMQETTIVPEGDSDSKQQSATILSLALLSLSSMFLLFSLVLYLYSDQGYLTLRWSSDYLGLYVLLAMLAFHYGRQQLKLISTNTPK